MPIPTFHQEGGGALADRAALRVLQDSHPEFVRYTWLDRGSDERQYCAPGIDLPVCSVMRTKYGMFPEYHTSADDFSVVTAKGLQGAFDVYEGIVLALESNYRYHVSCLGEPQLGRRGLYPTESFKGSASGARNMTNVISFCDGNHDLLDICDILGLSYGEVSDIVEKLLAVDLVTRVPEGNYDPAA